MGLTRKSVGTCKTDEAAERNGEKLFILAGNPNVGKSTVFNSLTGLSQHTGNWAGKTVGSAMGKFKAGGKTHLLADIPGTYSLIPHSREEEVARDFICFSEPDGVIVVCDATCLERNLSLVLQMAEITPNVLICVNLMDEAEKKGIRIDGEKLAELTGLPAVCISAGKNIGMESLAEEIEKLPEYRNSPKLTDYGEEIEDAITVISAELEEIENLPASPRWIALKILENDTTFLTSLKENCGIYTVQKPVNTEKIRDGISFALSARAKEIAAAVCTYEDEKYDEKDRKIDRFLTGRLTGIPVMLLLLCLVLWITLVGANAVSGVLSGFFSMTEKYIYDFLISLNIGKTLCDMAVFGVYRVLTWVVSVMLPPMAIFFPLFTLLEDLGYLPRVAFNLDKYFRSCNACGKQALTMCMGFGCNAAGVVGCRIIDSPRERLIAMLTNSFVPCNGRFPMLISVISMFVVSGVFPPLRSAAGAVVLTGFVFLGTAVSLAVSQILSKTLLKGTPSSFTLELPPFRKPDVLKVLVRSVIDRTLLVLARAVYSAIPAGIIIWVLANISVGGEALLLQISSFLDPFAKIFALDGVILLAFILGLPANEIVLPIIIMAYTASGTLTEVQSIAAVKELLIANGWTVLTAVNVIIFSIMHWPCATTLLTLKKESGSIKWTALAFLIPAAAGFLLCFLTATLVRIF